MNKILLFAFFQHHIFYDAGIIWFAVTFNLLPCCIKGVATIFALCSIMSLICSTSKCEVNYHIIYQKEKYSILSCFRVSPIQTTISYVFIDTFFLLKRLYHSYSKMKWWKGHILDVLIGYTDEDGHHFAHAQPMERWCGKPSL